VGSSSERLDPALYEGPDELDAQKLFLWSGSKLLDFLHQRLRDLHFLIGKLVPPRHPRSKDGGGPKLLEPEVFASGRLVLGVELFCPPAGVVFGHLEIEIWHVRAHLAAEAAGLVAQWVPDDENPAPKRPMGFNPQETFTERDKTRNMQNRIGIQIMELNPIREKKSAKKRVRGKR
jgi:hypothetical protein